MASNLPAKICIVTPALPPSIDGLGDYCRQLWRHWPGQRRESSGQGLCQVTDRQPWEFLVTAGAESSRRLWPEVTISQFDKSREGLLLALKEQQASTLVLQYVGYGYDAGGQPFWLAEALKQWQSASPGRRLVVMFHETWASGLPWQRVFWQSNKQKRCAAELLALASPAVTGNMATFRDLQSLELPNEIRLIPLGSSFAISSRPKKSWRTLLVVGKEASRLRAVKLHCELVRRLVQARLIDRIVLAGACANPETEPARLLLASWNLPVEIVSFCNFPSDRVPDQVLSCGLSLMHTQSTCLLKSTSFHLAAQLGQVPIALQELDPGEPVICGQHYLGYRAGQVDDILAALSKPELVQEIGSAQAQLGSTSLSWREIAKAWSNILNETPS